MGDLFANDQFSYIMGDWCEQSDTHHNIEGHCVYNYKTFLPDIPPALMQGNPMPLVKLAQVLEDKHYPNYGIIVYRYPTDTLDPVIQALKRNNVWTILIWRAPTQYRPVQRKVTSDELLRSIVTFLAGENVYPPQIEIIGSVPSQHRVFYTINIPNVEY